MMKKLKRLGDRLVGFFTKEGKEFSVPIELDPRRCGEINALRRGWYQSEKGELFVDFKITADDIVLM